MLVNVVPPQSLIYGGEVAPGRGGVFIAWKRECHRSQMTSRCFGLDLWLIAPFAGNQSWKKVLRYVVSFFVTIWQLVIRRPRLVFLLNQPMPLVFAVAIYAGLFSRPYVLDCHSNAYSPNRSRFGRAVYDWFTRKALFNINHNPQDQESVRAAGGQSVLVAEIPGDLDTVGAPAVEMQDPNCLVVCSFMRDEPIELFFKAAAQRPDIRFYLTGNYRKAPSSLIESRPANVELLGFIRREEYLGYLLATSVVVTLSSRSHIMQMAAEEALCVGRPLITNHSPVLEMVFKDSAEFIDLVPEQLAGALDRVLADQLVYRERMMKRRQVRREELRAKLDAINTRYFAHI